MTGTPNTLDPHHAWNAYQPDAGRPWNLRWAGHLYRRAAFAAAWPQLEQAQAAGPQACVKGLLRPPTDAVSAFDREYERYEASAGDSSGVDVLRGWWLRRMILSPHPLRERMTLFWLDFFAPRLSSAYAPQMMAAHVRLLRSQALGNFRELLTAGLRDPAVVSAANGGDNTRPSTGEPLARQLLEQYTLGPDSATGADLREAARALAGRHVQNGKYRDAAGDNSGAEKLLATLLARPATARHVVRKLYRALIAESAAPPDNLLNPLADAFAKDYDIARLVETLLCSNLFFSLTAYRQRIKSPVELAVGVVRSMEQLVPTVQLGNALTGMGQDLYRPPSLAGWEGGPAWIHQAAIIQRHNLTWALLSEASVYGGKLNPEALARRHSPAVPPGRFLLELFLQGDLDPQVIEPFQRGGSRPVREVAHAITTLPEFQLA